MTLQEVKELDPKSDSFVPQMLDFMIEHIPYEFHLRKAMEECFELGEVLAKTLNKAEHNRPSRSRLAEEAADLALRVITVMGTLYRDEGMDAESALEAGTDAFTKAFEDKLHKIQDWLKEGKLYNMKM